MRWEKTKDQDVIRCKSGAFLLGRAQEGEGSSALPGLWQLGKSTSNLCASGLFQRGSGPLLPGGGTLTAISIGHCVLEVIWVMSELLGVRDT